MSARKKVDNTSSPYKVGYCRPPELSRFKPGQSGNPRGRKPSSKNLADKLSDSLSRKRRVTIEGKSQLMTVEDIIVHRLMEGALSGDLKKMQFILTALRQANRPEPFKFSLTDIEEVKRGLVEIALEQAL